MKEWNDNFDLKRNIYDSNGNIITTITIGQQNFKNATIMIKEEDGKIIDVPMEIDKDGDIYFIYNNDKVYVSEYVLK